MVGYRAVAFHHAVDGKELVVLLRLTLHRLPRADAMIVGMDDERLAGGVETGLLHLPPQVGGGEKLHDELRGQFDELTRSVGEESAVVAAGPLLDGGELRLI